MAEALKRQLCTDNSSGGGSSSHHQSDSTDWIAFSFPTVLRTPEKESDVVASGDRRQRGKVFFLTLIDMH